MIPKLQVTIRLQLQFQNKKISKDIKILIMNKRVNKKAEMLNTFTPTNLKMIKTNQNPNSGMNFIFCCLLYYQFYAKVLLDN